MENWFYELSCFMEAIFLAIGFLFLFWIVSGLKSKRLNLLGKPRYTSAYA